MTKFKSKNVLDSVSNAIHGLKLAFFSQRNFVSELIISVIAVSLALVLKFTVTDLCILFIMIAIVLVCELLNSIIEFTLDAVYKNNYSELVKMAKDISAGMVLLTVIISAIVGLLLYGAYIIKYLF